MTVLMIILLLIVAECSSLPVSNVRTKLVLPPDIYEHGVTTVGGRTVAQKSFISIGRRSTVGTPREFGQRIQSPNARLPLNRRASSVAAQSAESLWPVGLFRPPININDLGYSWQDSGHMTPDFSNGLEHPDPLLLTGEDALMAVRYIYGLGELFYDRFPHVRALLRNQEERRMNGLHGHVLSSLRASSPFYKKGRF